MIRSAALSIKGLGLALGLAIVSCMTARAEVQDPCVADSVCRDHEDRGIAASAEKDYASALVEFKAAYARAPIPRLLINIGRSLYRLGQPADALRYYERYLLADPYPAPEVTQRVQRYIEEAKAAASAASNKPIERAPISQEKPGAVQPPPPEPPQAVSEPPAPVVVAKEAVMNHRQTRSFPPGAGVLLGLGTASLVAGIGLGVSALNLTREVVGNAGPFDEGLYAQGMTFNQAAISLDVIGGAVLAAGVIWAGVWSRQKSQPAQVRAGLLHSRILTHGSF